MVELALSAANIFSTIPRMTWLISKFTLVGLLKQNQTCIISSPAQIVRVLHTKDVGTTSVRGRYGKVSSERNGNCFVLIVVILFHRNDQIGLIGSEGMRFQVILIPNY